MKSFAFYQTNSIEQACMLLHTYRDSVKIIAGGTDLVLELNEGWVQAEHIVNINAVHAIRYCRCEGGIVRIGAGSTFAELDRNDYLRQHVKILHTAASNMGSPQIRNLATVGGNLVNASVAGDSLGALIALDASVVLQSVRGLRTMKLTEFYAGEQKTQIAPDELMTEIFFDAPNEHTVTSFVKLARREALAIVVIDVCGLLETDKAGICTRAQLAVGAVGRYPFRLPKIEAQLVGRHLNREICMATLPLFSDAVYESIKTRASVTYKKESVKGIAAQMFAHLLADLRLLPV